MEHPFKTVSQGSQPHKGSQALQLPFQLLWPPDCPQINLKIQALCSKVSNTAANTRELSEPSKNPYGIQSHQLKPSPTRPSVKLKTNQKSALRSAQKVMQILGLQHRSRPTSGRPRPAPTPNPDPDPDPEVSPKPTKEDWGEGSFDPG